MWVLGVEGSEKKSAPPRIFSGTALMHSYYFISIVIQHSYGHQMVLDVTELAGPSQVVRFAYPKSQ